MVQVQNLLPEGPDALLLEIQAAKQKRQHKARTVTAETRLNPPHLRRQSPARAFRVQRASFAKPGSWCTWVYLLKEVAFEK